MDASAEYYMKMEERLKEHDARIHDFKNRVDKSEEQMRKEYYALIEDIEAKREAAWKQLLRLKETADRPWEDLKDDMEYHWKDLYDAVTGAIDRFEERAGRQLT